MKKILFVTVFYFFFGGESFSQDSSIVLSLEFTTKKLPFSLTEEVPKNKPVVGLALSGGGARGLAQIGVLQAFSEKKIPIDIIVGTSMGSIIGGLFSGGYSAAELDSMIGSIDWQSLISLNNKLSRRDLFIDQKQLEEWAVITLRMKGLKPILPTSVNDGQRLTNELNLLNLQAPVKPLDDFDDLEVKFRAVCTDLESGTPVVLNSGSLTQAMRASSSVSFLLSPVEINSTILVDGGLVANIPVLLTKQEGADFVIAVNTTSKLSEKEELTLPWVVADQVLSIPMKILNDQQMRNADIKIVPNIGGASLIDFSNKDSIVFAGYNIAKVFADSITGQIDSMFIQRLKRNEFYIKNILVNEENAIGREFLVKYAYKDSVSTAEILHDLDHLHSAGNYKNTRARITFFPNYTEVKFEGEKIPIVQKINFTGITILDSAEVDSLLSSLKFKPFNAKRIVRSIKKILSLYRAGGYSLAELNKISFDENEGELSLQFSEGIIHEIIIEGNVYTDDLFIRREVPINAGELFRVTPVRQALVNLRSTNLFDNIILSVEKRDEKNILVFKVFERVSSLVRIGFKIDNENSPQLGIDLRDENLFGVGIEIGLMTYLSEKERAFNLEHKANRIFETYFTYKLNAFHRLNDVLTYRDDISKNTKSFTRSESGKYRQVFYGLSIALGTQVRRFGNLIFTGKYYTSEVKNIVENSVASYQHNIVSVGVSSIIDTQDKFPYPNSGLRIHAGYETGQQILGGSIGFSNIFLDYKSVVTVFNSHTFTMTLKTGFADKTLPLGLHYSLGGQRSFFGMRENEYRGRQIFSGAFEYRYHLPFQIFFDSFFLMRYDLGSIWLEQEQLRLKDFKHGAGVTLSLSTPIGPADFSLGKSFIFLKDGDKSFVSFGETLFYFSIGYQFNSF